MSSTDFDDTDLPAYYRAKMREELDSFRLWTIGTTIPKPEATPPKAPETPETPETPRSDNATP